MATEPIGLVALEARLQQDLAYLCWPAAVWMPERFHNGERVLDVVIIGAGQSGLAVAVGLQKLGMAATLFDRAPDGLEGPWSTTARMETLRSPKQLTGPALGLPSLTFRAWFEAQWGDAAWGALDKIPRLQWMDYLRWYRQAMGIAVRNNTQVLNVQPRGDGLVKLTVQEGSSPAQDVLARRVVLATGRDGLGGALVPDFVQGLPRHLWAHSSDEMDYATLAGKRVAVVGAGASAMDSAATALEAGASRVDLLIRRATIPRINKSKAASTAGLVHAHFDLPDAWKWRIRHYINAEQVPPPRGSTQRVSRHANSFFHVSTPVLGVAEQGGALRVETPQGPLQTDFLIVSTGFKVDWHSRPEFAAIAPHVRAWRSRYTPPAGDEDDELADSPVLGPAFELQEAVPGLCPGLNRVHCFCFPATLSHGTVSGDIPSLSDGARRLANGLASLFYNEDIEHHFGVLQAFSEPELLGDEWTPAPPFKDSP